MDPLLLYIIASIFYIMVIHFAVKVKKQFDGWFFMGTFVLGGFFGWVLDSYPTGFIFAVIFTFLFW